MIVHINGYSGSGKTTLGYKIKQTLPDVLVQDLDEFLPNESENLSCLEQRMLVQNRINEFLMKKTNNNVETIILLGTACNDAIDDCYPHFILRNQTENKDGILVDYLIWYDVSIEEAATRSLRRQINWSYHHLEEFIENTKQMSINKTSYYLLHYFNYHQRCLDWEPLYLICKNRHYIPMSEEKIIEFLKCNVPLIIQKNCNR